MDLAEHIISLERSALDRWIRADPDGYLSLYAKDATYFDPFREKRVDGLDELNAGVAAMRGITLTFTERRYDMIRPRVDVEGNIANPQEALGKRCWPGGMQRRCTARQTVAGESSIPTGHLPSRN